MLSPVFGQMGPLWHGLALSTYPTDSEGGTGDRGESGVGLPFSLMKRGCCLFRQGAGERARGRRRGRGSGHHVRGGRQVRGRLKKAGESEGGAMCPPVSLHAASPAAIPVAPRLVASCAVLRLPVQSGVVWHCPALSGASGADLVPGCPGPLRTDRGFSAAPYCPGVRLGRAVGPSYDVFGTSASCTAFEAIRRHAPSRPHSAGSRKSDSGRRNVPCRMGAATPARNIMTGSRPLGWGSTCSRSVHASSSRR